MTVSISSINFDPDAVAIFEEDPTNSAIKDLEPRVSRSKALNGESVIETRGFVEGDRTLTIETLYDETLDATLTQIFKVHQLAYCGTRDGIFTVVPFKVEVNSDTIQMTLFVKEKND